MDLYVRNLLPWELEKWFDFLCRDIFPDDPRHVIEDMWYGDREKKYKRYICRRRPRREYRLFRESGMRGY